MNLFNLKTRQNVPEQLLIEQFIKSGLGDTTHFCDWLLKEGFEPAWRLLF